MNCFKKCDLQAGCRSQAGCRPRCAFVLDPGGWMKPWGNAGRPRRGIRSHVAPAQGLPQRLLAVVDVQLAVNGPNVAVHRVAASRKHAIRCPATAAKSQRRVASISGSSSTITIRIMPFFGSPLRRWQDREMGFLGHGVETYRQRNDESEGGAGVPAFQLRTACVEGESTWSMMDVEPLKR